MAMRGGVVGRVHVGNWDTVMQRMQKRSGNTNAAWEALSWRGLGDTQADTPVQETQCLSPVLGESWAGHGFPSHW